MSAPCVSFPGIRPAWLLLGVLLIFGWGGLCLAGEDLEIAVDLIDSKAQAEKLFKGDIVARGLFALNITLRNHSSDITCTVQRSNLLVLTEFDVQIPAIEARRAYDRMMWNVAGGPYFGEAGLVRTISESSRKKKYKKTVLAEALPETVTLAPHEEISGIVFFEMPAGVKSVRFSTLLLQEIVNEQTGERLYRQVPLSQ
ncbi:MAG: hypothetical protein JXQ27_15730 [Acidobacteria bacterium]|nr:hypothetical protein [Acidobacteriota bacterium]